ncbi:CaiB/BaiF CoA transferase family protein [Prauserella flavalba]|uniref:Carnitine dehydratase n=1 Tax=Prauserella flavalba TaxID=1477506 RepID=A0A318LGM1_9PSEU|nr:CaiB/BaiF CoA-transferase family protein [Prauserella flavalba]PXY18724.1 carnitine dehydratase [Prauserella flavalba]
MPTGPLDGVRVIELAGLGPTPFAGMLLAELGADVVRIDRPPSVRQVKVDPRVDLLNRGKRSVVLDLRAPDDKETLSRLIDQAQLFIEGYRPGVAERLGVGPDECFRRNPRLVYGRMTGWGQDGPLASAAGHDVNYIAITGALHAIGDAGNPPQIPLNLVGNFGGGATYLVIGLLAALHEAQRNGTGQVIDASIVDGTAHLLAWVHGKVAAGEWSDERGTNLLDGGAPCYRVYETADGKYLTVGALEAPFYAQLLDILGLDEDPSRQRVEEDWPRASQRIAAAFRTRTQAEWLAAFADSDACVAPVAGLREAAEHPHIRARGTLVERDGVLQAAPAPRFSRTTTAVRAPAPQPGAHQHEVLRDWLGAAGTH